MDLVVRNLDAAVGAKLTQLAAKKHMSREAYIRSYLESLAVLDDLKALDYKYESLVKELVNVIESNNQKWEHCSMMLNELKEKVDKLD